MLDLVGIFSIFFVFVFVIFIAIRWPGISHIIIVAFIIRIIFLLLGSHFIALPDSNLDANSFETRAWTIAQAGFFNLSNYYVGPDSKFISFLIAIPYSIFGRSILMAKSISLFFGLSTVFLGWRLAGKIWDDDNAKKVAWIIALFPSLILYSVLTMREAYISFFILVGIYGAVIWAKTDSFKGILVSIVGFTAATFFHGASIIGAMSLLMIVGIASISRFFKSLFILKISPKILITLIITIIFLILYLTNQIYVPYIKDFQFMSDTDVLLRKSRTSVMGTAGYPEWTIAKSAIELVYKLPIRAIYFILAPFPWDVKEIKHLIGMFDAFLYGYLIFLTWMNKKIIMNDPALLIIFLILISYIIVFAVGVGNFGTGIRHRSKFVIMFILLSAPLIKNLTIKIKKD